MSVLAPWRPPAGSAAPPEVALRYLNTARRWLHPDPFPSITERQRVDQALAATERGRP